MERVLLHGEKRQSPNSETISLFGESLVFDLEEGFPLVTTRKINYRAAFGELFCFLNGYTDLRSFKKEGVNFWDADCQKENWQNNPNCKGPNDLGKIYGYQWTQGFGFNQIEKLIHDLRENPLSRRHLMMTYNPKDLGSMCLPPCYVSHQFYVTRGTHLDMMVHQRSADLCIGVPFDIASFALFQSLLAQEVGLRPGTLKVVFGDVHIYKEHIIGATEQLSKQPQPLPTLNIGKDTGVTKFADFTVNISGYTHHEAIKYPFIVQE